MSEHLRQAIRDGLIIREGKRALKVGDVVPMPERKLDVRPAFTGAGKPAHRPARKPGRFGA